MRGEDGFGRGGVSVYIFTSDKKSILDSVFVERFCIVQKPDAVLVIASYNADRAVTIGKYADLEEAHGVLAAMYVAISAGDENYTMPDSRLFGEDFRKRDARTKRKGGS